MATLVVGADGGIGRAVVASLAGQGEQVVPLDRTTGVNAADPGAVHAYLAGQPPCTQLVHVAGTTRKASLMDHTIEDWRRVLDDNLTSIFVTVQAVVPAMRAAGGGAIVVTSSTAGRNGGTALTGVAYNAAKGGVVNLARALAAELAPDGIRVNCVAPGLVDTPMLDVLSRTDLDSFVTRTPIARLIPAGEIAATIMFLLSPAAASITGAVIDQNGGRWMG